MMKKVIGIAAILALALPVMAQQGPPVAEPAHQIVVKVLNLTPEQTAQWDALLATRQATVTPLREDLADVLDQLKTLFEDPNPDPTAVGNLTIQAHDLRVQIREANQAYLDGFQALLDEEQAAKLAFLRRADKARPVLPAFKRFGLVPRDERR